MILVLGSIAAGFAQTAATGPESLGDAARALKSENKSKPAAAKFSNDSRLVHKALIPDVASDGRDNIDEILQSIADYHAAHNLPETEAVVHDWYNQQVALLTNAIKENHGIEQRKREKARDSSANDVSPKNHDESMELRRGERVSRKEDRKRITQNQLLVKKIEEDFRRVRPQMQDKYGMKVDWFTICEDAGCSY
ncbi:MAG TPA: hypothetical protein VGJ51_02465 [Candidatus Angelobacter sp.]